MVGNIALDVVIGLIFIYLLYSLYATIIMEFISSSLGLRARNLNYALKRMLMDEKKYESTAKRWGSRMLTTITSVWGRSTNLKNRYLYTEFFNQPNIKYVSSGGINNKPSYLNPESFAKGVIDVLKNRDPDISVLAGVEEGLTKLPEDSETRRHLQSLLDDANNDVVKFKILLEGWYNETMDRATGWFKRSTQVILVVIGFVLAIFFNVDSIAIIKKLSTDKDARAQLVKMAIDFTENNKELIEAARREGGDTITNQTLILNRRLDSLETIQTSLKEDIISSQNILASDWNVPGTVKYYYKSNEETLPNGFVQVRHVVNGKPAYLAVHKSVDTKILKGILPGESVTNTLEVSALLYKLSYVFSFNYFWGYLMTVLALSLGAPFWFDLLNKLIKLRSSKAISSEPESKSGTAGLIVNRTILNRAG